MTVRPYILSRLEYSHINPLLMECFPFFLGWLSESVYACWKLPNPLDANKTPYYNTLAGPPTYHQKPHFWVFATLRPWPQMFGIIQPCLRASSLVDIWKIKKGGEMHFMSGFKQPGTTETADLIPHFKMPLMDFSFYEAWGKVGRSGDVLNRQTSLPSLPF